MLHSLPIVSESVRNEFGPTDAAQLCQELAFPLTLTLSPGRGNTRLCRAGSWREYG